MVATNRGSKILFSRIVTTSLTAKYDVLVMNADGSEVKNLTNEPNFHDLEPTWSPDGRQIAFVRDPDLDSDLGQGASKIWRMRADGASPTKITKTAASDYSPDWLPRGAGLPLTGDNGVDTGTGQGNGAGTGNAANGTAAGDASDSGSLNNASDVINGTTPIRQLPNTGGVPLLGLAVCAFALVGIGFSVLRATVRRDP